MSKERKYKVMGVILSLIVILILTNIFLWDFKNTIENEEKKYVVSSLSDLATQGAEIVETRIQLTMSILRDVSQTLRYEENMQGETVKEYLETTLKDDTLDIEGFGIADRDGMSATDEGKIVDISDREYFKKSIQGEEFISGSTKSKIKKEDVIFLSVPVYSIDDSVKGVLYSVIRVDSFNIYKDTKLEDSSKNMHIIDSAGNYVTQAEACHLLLEHTNFFDEIDQYNTSFSVANMREKLQKNEAVYTEIEKDGEAAYVYITPIDINEWYIFTIISDSAIHKKVDYVQKNVFYLTVKIMATLIGFALIYFMILIYEKQKAEKRNKELSMRDEKIKNVLLSGAIHFYEVNLTEDKLVKSDRAGAESRQSFTEIWGQFTEEMIVEQDRKKVFETCLPKQLLEAYERGAADFSVEYRYVGENQTVCWGKCEIHLEKENTNKNIFAYLTLRDIDEQKRKELHLEKRAALDALTKTYNRSAAIKKINQSLREKNEHSYYAFMIIDLDHFKELNDTLGHAVGDKALVDVAEILKKNFRKYDIVCRLGGDEFVILLQEIPLEVLDKIVGNLNRKLELSYEKAGKKSGITASIGIAIAPVHGETFDELYEKADQALYAVKKSTRNSYQIYEE